MRNYDLTENCPVPRLAEPRCQFLYMTDPKSAVSYSQCLWLLLLGYLGSVELSSMTVFHMCEGGSQTFPSQVFLFKPDDFLPVIVSLF